MPGSRAARSPPAPSRRCLFWPHGGDAEPSSERSCAGVNARAGALGPNLGAPKGSPSSLRSESSSPQDGLPRPPRSSSALMRISLFLGPHTNSSTDRPQDGPAYGARARTAWAWLRAGPASPKAGPEAGVRARGDGSYTEAGRVSGLLLWGPRGWVRWGDLSDLGPSCGMGRGRTGHGNPKT